MYLLLLRFAYIGLPGSRGFKCGQEEGHMSRDCPNSDSSGGGGGKGCFHCGEDGNMSRDCLNVDACWGRGENSSADGAERPNGCFKCQQEGHMAKDCTNEPVPRMGLDGKPMEAPYCHPLSPPMRTPSFLQSLLASTLTSMMPIPCKFDKYEANPLKL
ncbi:hypothetical protein MRX96_008865 [Rhipicephalus microplus]